MFFNNSIVKGFFNKNPKRVGFGGGGIKPVVKPVMKSSSFLP